MVNSLLLQQRPFKSRFCVLPTLVAGLVALLHEALPGECACIFGSVAVHSSIPGADCGQH